MAESRLRQVEVREDIGAKRPLQLRGGDLLDPVLRVLFGGVVDEDVEPSEFPHGLLDRLPAPRGIADIAG